MGRDRCQCLRLSTDPQQRQHYLTTSLHLRFSPQSSKTLIIPHHGTEEEESYARA